MLKKIAELVVSFIESRAKVNRLAAEIDALRILCRKYLDSSEEAWAKVDIAEASVQSAKYKLDSQIALADELRTSVRKLDDECEILRMNIRLLTEVNERNIQRIRAETATAIAKTIPVDEESNQ